MNWFGETCSCVSKVYNIFDVGVQTDTIYTLTFAGQFVNVDVQHVDCGYVRQ